MAAEALRVSSFILEDPLPLDIDTFRMWLSGYNAADTAAAQHRQDGAAPATLALYASEVVDKFRVFRQLGHYLVAPLTLVSQNVLPLAPSARLELVQAFYSFDDAVMRELMGLKLSSKERRDLDDVSDKTGVPLPSCRRQFDNLSRIVLHARNSAEPLHDAIRGAFLLGEELAQSYAVASFACIMRFDTTKRRLPQLGFGPFSTLLSLVMGAWSTPRDTAEGVLDGHFTVMLRDMKAVFGERAAIEGYRTAAATQASKINTRVAESGDGAHALSPRIFSPPEFRELLRGLMHIASTLYHHKEVRSVFVEVDRFTELLVQRWGVGEHEVPLLFEALQSGLAGVPPGMHGRSRQAYSDVWLRFLTVVQGLCVVMARKLV